MHEHNNNITINIHILRNKQYVKHDLNIIKYYHKANWPGMKWNDV